MDWTYLRAARDIVKSFFGAAIDTGICRRVNYGNFMNEDVSRQSEIMLCTYTYIYNKTAI